MRWTLLLVTVACADLEPRAPAVCGNAVQDDGEDCDSNEPGCVACRFVCTTAADCPPAWGCGLDGLCRHAIGKWKAPNETFPGVFLTTSLEDIDRDGRLDVLGFSGTSLSLDLGRDDARFVSTFSTQATCVAYGDLDADGALDLVAGGPRTLKVALGDDREGGFALAHQPALAARDAIPIKTGAGRVTDLALVTATGPGTIDLAIHRIGVPIPPSITLAAPPQQALQRPRALDVDDDGIDELVVLAVGAAESTALVFDVIPLDAQSSTLVSRTTIAIPAPTDRVFAVDLTGDAVRDLVFADSLESTALVAAGDGVGGFGPIAPDPELALAGTLGGFADLDGDGDQDVVGSAGIVLLEGGAGTLVDAGFFARAALGDINRDGVADVVTAVGGGVQLLLGGALGFTRSTHLVGFNVAEVTAGDLDGDGFDDVVAKATGGSVEEPTTKLVVVFGGPSGLTDEVVVAAEFPVLGLVLEVDLADLALDPVSRATDPARDLVVRLPPPAAGVPPDVVLLLGNGDRRFEAGLATPADPLAAVIGRLDDQPGTDILVIYEDAIELVQGRGDARLLAADRRALAPSSAVDWCLRYDTSAVRGAYVVDLDGDGKDEIVGIPCDEARADVVQIARVVGDALVIDDVTFTVPGLSPVGDSALRDLDADGSLDLVLTLTGDNGMVPGALVIVWGGSGTLGETTILTESELGLGSLGRVTAVRGDDDLPLELVVTSNANLDPGQPGTIVLVDLADRSLVGSSPVLPLRVGATTAGDVDRDGVDDLVTRVFEGYFVLRGCAHDDPSLECR